MIISPQPNESEEARDQYREGWERIFGRKRDYPTPVILAEVETDSIPPSKNA